MFLYLLSQIQSVCYASLPLNIDILVLYISLTNITTLKTEKKESLGVVKMKFEPNNYEILMHSGFLKDKTIDIKLIRNPLQNYTYCSLKV